MFPSQAEIWEPKRLARRVMAEIFTTKLRLRLRCRSTFHRLVSRCRCATRKPTPFRDGIQETMLHHDRQFQQNYEDQTASSKAGQPVSPACRDFVSFLCSAKGTNRPFPPVAIAYESALSDDDQRVPCRSLGMYIRVHRQEVYVTSLATSSVLSSVVNEPVIPSHPVTPVHHGEGIGTAVTCRGNPNRPRHGYSHWPQQPNSSNLQYYTSTIVVADLPRVFTDEQLGFVNHSSSRCPRLEGDQ